MTARAAVMQERLPNTVDSRPKILQIGNRWFPENPGGLERYHYDLARHLPSSGFEIENLVLATAVEQIGPGVGTTAYASPRAPLPRRLSALRRAVQMQLRNGAVSLVACHYPLYGLPIWDLIASTPAIFHFHGPWSAEGKFEGNSVPAWIAKWCIEQILYGRPAGFIALSSAFADILHHSYGVPLERIFVIPGGVDTERFRPDGDRMAAREALKLPRGRPIALSIRRLNRRMGLENLIDAMPLITQRVPDLLLLIGGTGPLHSEFQRRIAYHKLENRVRLLGRIPEQQLPIVYRAADVSIVPSISLEGFGLTAAESLACGTPVLVTPVGGLPEVVANLSPDLILKSQRPADLAEGISALFEGRLSLPMPTACVHYARRNFAWPVISERVGSVYTAILGRG